MDPYFISIKTKKFLGNRLFLTDFLSSWCDEDDLNPEFFDLGEPIRQSLEVFGIEAAIDTWLSHGMGLMFRRRSSPKFVAEFDWFDRAKGLDNRMFPWGCTVDLDRKAGDLLAKKLFRFFVQALDADFGFLTTEFDIKEKHFVSIEESTGIIESFEGVDILDDEQKLPGVYWNTYFGPWAVGQIGKSRFKKLDILQSESLNGGILMSSFESSSEIGTSKAKEIEIKTKGVLGANHFFDKKTFETLLIRESPEETGRINNLIGRVKSKRKS